jgi:tryptophan synthase beta subunit
MVAIATVVARFGMECEIFMVRRRQRQSLNVFVEAPAPKCVVEPHRR